MGTAFGLRDIAAVVNWEEDVGGFGEIWQGFAEGARIWGLEDHEGHAGSEENDVGGLVSRQKFVFKVSGAAGDQCWV